MGRARMLPAGLLLLGACHRPDGVTLDVGNATSAPSWLVVAVADGGPVLQVTCPDGPPDGDLSCTSTGARLASVPDTLEATVKARGFDFVSGTWATDDLDREGDDLQVPLASTPLPAFTRNDDYATGFGPDDLPAFTELAWASDTELGPTLLVKFYLADLQGSPQVYFQNTPKHPLHYDFAHEVLGVPLSATEFWIQTYSGEDRTAMAGTLVLYDGVTATSEAVGSDVEAPVAVTFFPSDDLSPSLAVRAHELLEERIGFAPLTGGGPNRVAYLPAGSVQEAELAAARSVFDHRASAWLVHEELWGGATLQVLNEGEAWGTLRRLSSEELADTVVSYTDILVLTDLPNDLPIVGGTITEEFQTPLAHVNLAAMARGTPNIAYLDAGTDPSVQALLGGIVHFVAADGAFVLEAATLEEAQAFWDARQPAPVVLEADLSLDGLPAFADLGFADSVRVGTKAANLAELHALLGEAAPDGFAVPFSAWARFFDEGPHTCDGCMDASVDCVDEGREADLCDRAMDLCCAGTEPETLRAYTLRLLADPDFAADSSLREALLDGLRYEARNTDLPADLAAELDARVAEVFGTTSVRMRSSTNAEDLQDFSGAGLYDSCSVDADELAHEEIRKVWASAWNWAAFEERSWWGIDQASVYMGVAVHPAYGDEAANGVLITQNVADPTVVGMYVNVQLGEASVTNPEDGALPEIFSIVPGTSPGEVQVVRLSWSSLSPGVPILSDAEVQTLYDLAYEVQQHFAPLYGENPDTFALDLEFKVEEGDRDVSIKQVRPFAGW